MSSSEELLSFDEDSSISRIKIPESADHLCFGCSKHNPIGLKLDFYEDNDVIKAVFIPDKFHQGWPGYTHGGILFTLLDEAGGFAVRKAGVEDCVTAKSEIRYVSPAREGEQIQITARVVKMNKRIVEIEATLFHADGSIIAKNISQWCPKQKPTD